MRTTLVPSLLNTAAYNLARQNDRVALFEVGRVFLPKALPLTEQPAEKTRLCVVLSGKRNELNWTESKDAVDFFDLKGDLELVLEVLQASGVTYAKPEREVLHPGKSCTVSMTGRPWASWGPPSPGAGPVGSAGKPSCWNWI